MKAPTRWISAKEAADRTGLSPRTIRAYAEQGQLPHYKVGTRILFGAEEVETWMMSRRVK